MTKPGTFLFFIVIIVLLSATSLPVGALEADEITAKSAILMDADTGQILYEKNSGAKMYPASTTKIMTGMLALESLQPEDILIVNASAVDELEYGTSHIALTYDEELTLKDAMYALMLPSANDAANVLAEHVAGSQAEFARMMTDKARQLGAFGTNFVNAHGLHDDQHYTTAYDMALITSAAIQNAEFVRYFGTGRYTMPSTNKQPEERPFTNQQYMLLEEMWVYYPELIGGKVGYTDKAKHTMSSAARKNGRTLVAVVLESGKDEKFYDTQELLDFGFDNFNSIVISSTEIKDHTVPIMDDDALVGEVTFSLEEDVTLLLYKGISREMVELTYDIPSSFDRKDKIEGVAKVFINDTTVTGIPTLLLDLKLDAHVITADTAVWNTIDVEPKPTFQFSVTKHIYLPVGIVLLCGLIIIMSLMIIQQRKRKKARLERLQRRLRYRNGTTD